MQISELIIQPSLKQRDIVIVGAIAGVTAGLAMAFWGVLTSVFHGMDLLAMFQITGATFMGADATGGGFVTTLYGFGLHIVASAAFGVLFTAFLPADSTPRQAVARGLGFAMIILLTMTFIVTPIINPILRNAVATLPKSWIIQHALFGVSLGLVPLIWRLYNDEGIRVRLRETGAVVVRRRQLPVPGGFPVVPGGREAPRVSRARYQRRPTVGPPHAVS